MMESSGESITRNNNEAAAKRDDNSEELLRILPQPTLNIINLPTVDTNTPTTPLTRFLLSDSKHTLPIDLSRLTNS